MGHYIQDRIVRQTRTLDGRGQFSYTIEVEDTYSSLVEFFDVADN